MNFARFICLLNMFTYTQNIGDVQPEDDSFFAAGLLFFIQ